MIFKMMGNNNCLLVEETLHCWNVAKLKEVVPALLALCANFRATSWDFQQGCVIFCLKNWGINPQRKAFFMGSMIFLSIGWDGVPHFWHNPKNLQGTPHTVRPAVSRCYRIQLLRLYMSILDPTPDCRFDVFFNSKLHSWFLVSQLPLAVLPSSWKVKKVPLNFKGIIEFGLWKIY